MRSQDKVDEIHAFLFNELELKTAVSIHGRMPQKAREEAVEAFKSGKAIVMTATYRLCSRGMNTKDLQMLIMMSCPKDLVSYKTYFNRAGRLSNIAKSMLFFDDSNKPEWLPKLVKFVKVNNSHVSEDLQSKADATS